MGDKNTVRFGRFESQSSYADDNAVSEIMVGGAVVGTIYRNMYAPVTAGYTARVVGDYTVEIDGIEPRSFRVQLSRTVRADARAVLTAAKTWARAQLAGHQGGLINGCQHA